MSNKKTINIKREDAIKRIIFIRDLFATKNFDTITDNTDELYVFFLPTLFNDEELNQLHNLEELTNKSIEILLSQPCIRFSSSEQYIIGC